VGLTREEAAQGVRGETATRGQSPETGRGTRRLAWHDAQRTVGSRRAVGPPRSASGCRPTPGAAFFYAARRWRHRKPL